MSLSRGETDIPATAATIRRLSKNASGVDKQLLPDQGSVLNTTAGASDNIFQYPPSAPLPVPTPNTDLPPSKLNPNWATQSAIFDGNLQNRAPELKLPVKIDDATTPLIEMIKRGKKIADSSGGDLYSNSGTLAPVVAGTADSDILKEERFANKAGIRVSLADSKAKLRDVHPEPARRPLPRLRCPARRI